MQDALLSAERKARGVVDVMTLPVVPLDARLSLWQGDITRLNADAIVNAANSALLGCFIPCHRCIDNAIHSAAGLQLRAACEELMKRQGHPEPTGAAKITAGHNYAPMPASDVYPNLLHLVEGRDYFILTTNVDHAFQRSGAAKERIFYTQGDYGLFQSSRPTGASAGKTYDNEESVRAMLTAQGFAFAEDGTLLPPESDAPVMVIPSDLIPCCPDDGMEMATNLRADGSFVEDAG